jgi:catechol 2,3-dioxygenase-like lactoylglutathione lyase family enzyme
MIIPNLMVRDIHASLAFYREMLDFDLVFAIDRERNIHQDPSDKPITFATLAWNDAQLMLQTVDSLAEDVPSFSPSSEPTPSGTIYVRGYHPDRLAGRDLSAITVKAPFLQWYGMKELYLRDPDGYIICLGAAEGTPPD